MATPDMKQRADAPSATLEGYARYAIYYAPREDEPLAAFGAEWFGGRADSGDHARPRTALDPEAQVAMTRDPKRYGLHGTLKAPFALARGVSIEALDGALWDFAAARPVASWPGWRLSGAHGFMALRPNGPAPGLEALAAGVVAHFAPFGAPPSEQEALRRRRYGLSARQEAYLALYGYPYVLDDFAFHVTLTGALSEPEAEAVRRALAEPLAAVIAAPRAFIRDLCLFGDPGEGRPFDVLQRYALAPTR